MFALGVVVGVLGTTVVEIVIAIITTNLYERKGEKNGNN